MVVTAYNDFAIGIDDTLSGNTREIIQDYPGEGGLAPNGPNTDQTENGQALLFEQTPGMSFLPTVRFNDNHGLSVDALLVGVHGFIGGAVVFSDIIGAPALGGGALLGENANIDQWLFYGVDGQRDWYVGAMSTVPEPGTATLLGFGLMACAARRRKALA